MPPKRTSASKASAMTQAAIKKLVADSVAVALEAKLATMAIRKMEDELYNQTVKENDLKPYVRRFQELAVLCPNMVPNIEKLPEAFIGGLPRRRQGNLGLMLPMGILEIVPCVKGAPASHRTVATVSVQTYKSIGVLKHVNALVEQGSDVNVMPYSIYVKLTDERTAEIDIRLSLASHSYIYPLGIVEDVLVKVVEHVYPVDFVILNIMEDEKRPFILGTPFLTTAKAVIKFNKGTIVLRSGKSKISFHRIPDSPCLIKRGVKNDIEPIAPTMTVNRLVLEWEERIKLHLEREMEFNRWKGKNFKGKHPTLVIVKGRLDDKGKVTFGTIGIHGSIYFAEEWGRKVKSIASFLALGWHLEGIHVTWGSFGEETDEITDLHQILEEILLTERGNGIASIKRRRHDPSSNGVRDLVTASGRGRLNEDLESST
ncbi:zinc finger, CCHC-type containing protein [Tanacetum coccineum]